MNIEQIVFWAGMATVFGIAILIGQSRENQRFNRQLLTNKRTIRAKHARLRRQREETAAQGIDSPDEGTHEAASSCCA